MKLAWLTDLHLNFLAEADVQSFCDDLARTEADVFLISGDIGDARNVVPSLEQLDEALARPIYFVLGNHDFYHGSIAGVRKQVEAACIASRYLHWLPLSGVVPLSQGACLIGHDGWADGRFGDYQRSDVELNDFHLISELTGLNRAERLTKMQELADETSVYFRTVLPEALAFRHVLAVTHVPPFRESCWHEGRISNDDWLPFFSCKAVGDALREAMQAHPDRKMTVLCGHTHGAGEAQILPNLKVLTGGAEYGQPALQRVLVVN